MNILFITSYSTGEGHKSITEALCKQIERQDANARISVIDGFAIGNWVARTSGRIYNTLAVHCPYLWEIIYRMADVFPVLINFLTAQCLKKNLLKHIESSQPDIIISVHAAFVGSTLMLLEGAGLSIPVVSIVADLDNVTKLWADKRALAVICPTEEAKQKMVSSGMPEDKVKVLGFPIRQEFINRVDSHTDQAENEILSALLVSGSQGSRRILKIVKILVEHQTCQMRIITGKNKTLKKALEQRYTDTSGSKIEVLGFTTEIDKYMLQADILIARASPNVVMEAVNLRKPVIITDFFYGQEKKNPAFIENHHLGVVCTDLQHLPEVLQSLCANNSVKLRAIQNSQDAFRKENSAEKTAAYILQLGEPRFKSRQSF
jgi:processive 1,2-diacylglycerol beta-glucosyltransferase